MWTFAFFGAKIIGFFKIYDVSAQTRERVNPMRHFSDKREGSIFRDFVWKSFMNDPLPMI